MDANSKTCASDLRTQTSRLFVPRYEIVAYAEGVISITELRFDGMSMVASAIMRPIPALRRPESVSLRQCFRRLIMVPMWYIARR